MKEFFAWLVLCLLFAFVFIFGISYALADEPPNNQCNSGDAAQDVECMRKEWRPKKQISYDTGQRYCYSEGGQLRGHGEIVLNVDDMPHVFKIDCK